MAVEYKVTLWMESMGLADPRLLEHHIRLGNSLVGAPKDAYAIGIPDGAFKGLEGDDKTALKSSKSSIGSVRKSVSTGLFEGQPESATDLRHPSVRWSRCPMIHCPPLPTNTRPTSNSVQVMHFKVSASWTWTLLLVPKTIELNPLQYHGITNDYLDVLAGRKSPSSNLAVDEAAIERWTSELVLPLARNFPWSWSGADST